MLYYRDLTPESSYQRRPPAKLNVLPLLSGATSQLAAAKTNSFPTLDDTNSFDINHARFAGDTQGWVGAAPGSTARPSLRGQWLDLADSDGKVTSRCAYWMQDETFKTNVNLLGKTPRGSNTLGITPAEIPLQGIIKAVNSSNADSIANSVWDFRSQFRTSFFFEQRDLNQVSGQSTLGDDLKFVTTIQSAASNQSRSGARRVNLNKVVSTSTDATEIRKQLDEIIKTISSELPNFSQRFYRTGSDKNSLDVTSTGTPSHQRIYLNKIAANIRDYIDTDSQPTIVNNDSSMTVNIGGAP